MRRARHRVIWLILAMIAASVAVAVLVRLRRRVDRATIQRRFWGPVYDRLAWLYDGVDWFTCIMTQRFRLHVLAHLPSPGSRVLEIGFGTGRLHVDLAGMYDMAGLDPAPGMLRVTEHRLANRGLHSDLRLGSVYTIPWPDATFDAVIATFAFSAFPDAGAALDEMLRVTNPGGRIVIVDAGEARDGNLFARALARLWELLGDFMRDEVPLMQARGLEVSREEYGPWGCVHCVTAVRPLAQGSSSSPGG